MAAESIGGVIVTGDIAYVGQATQCEAAGAWLDELTSAIKRNRSDAYVAPGNNDISSFLIN